MIYPQDFVEKTRQIYGNSQLAMELLEKNDLLLGYYLDKWSLGTIPAISILKAKSLHEIKEIAQVEMAKVDLYNEWFNLTKEERAKVDLEEQYFLN